MRDRWRLLGAWRDERRRREAPDYFRNLLIFEALLGEARTLGVLPLKDRLEGLEKDIQLARKINAGGTARTDGPGSG